MTQKHKVIGIDLGTTYSAVAAYDGYTEQAEIIKDEGEVTTPSVVSIDSRTGRVIVGRPAKKNLGINPRDTVIEIKREMGELFSRDTLVKYRVPTGRFREKEPVHARLGGEDDWFLPQEISAFILMRMKEIAEREIGEEIRDAVVTVPAYFTANQKKATEEAALMAGLYPRQLIPEPTAAAICYGVDRMEQQRRVYLVYDLGGGTFDVSIIEVEGGNVSVIATSGDPRLGGGDFDDRITAWAVAELRTKHGIDVSSDPLAPARIKYQAEDLKIKLSTYEQAEMQLLWLRPQQPPTLVLTRAVFEQMIGDLLARSLNSVDAALKSAEAKGVRREDVSAILLVGGSTNIPAAKRGLLEYFRKPKEFVRDDLDPAAVVARGAAILAHRFAPSPPPFDVRRQTQSTELNREADMSQSIRLITEHSLGVGLQGGTFDCLIRQGTNIPVQVTKGGYSNAGPTTHLLVEVFQGEAPTVYDNTQIGVVQVGPMELREKDFHHFELTYALDANGLLSVQVKHLNTGQVYQGHFEHQTSVKGADALAVMRGKLLRLYQPAAMTAALPPAPPAGMPAPGGPEVSPAYAPPPYPPPAPTGTSAPAGGQAPGGYAPPAGPPSGQIPPPTPGASSSYVPPLPPGVPAGSGSQQPPGPPPWASPASAVTPPPAPPMAAAPLPTPVAAAAGMLEPVREVPEALKSVVRRSKKRLLQKPDAVLLAKLNSLIEAINAGRPEDDLNDLGDELENVYHDARSRA